MAGLIFVRSGTDAADTASGGMGDVGNDHSSMAWHAEKHLPIYVGQGIFHPRWSGGRVAEGTGLLNAPPAFCLLPCPSVSVLLRPLSLPRPSH
jgi:hypothetical protein